MKDQECSLGRVFVLLLEEGDRVPETIEQFAEQKNVERALCLLLSSFKGGRLVSGVDEGKAKPVAPLTEHLQDIHEAAGIGTIFPGEYGTPKLHMHAALGKEGSTRVGCIRAGTEVWNIGEVVLLELVGTSMRRRVDSSTGLEVLSDI
jgi:predicted DNA-binding protein with PD1-like motif